MKIRKGFVSNSSSCSFLVLLDEEPNTKVDMKEYCDLCGNLTPYEEQLNENLKKISDNFDNIPKDVLPAIKKIMSEATYKTSLFFVPDCDVYNPDEVWTPEMVAEEFQKEYEAGKGKVLEMEQDEEFSNAYYPKGYIPVEQWLSFPTWKEDLQNPNGYFRRAIKDNIRRELEEVEFSEDMKMESYDRPLEMWRYEKDSKQWKTFEELLEMLTQEHVEWILNEFGDCQGYFIEYITDGDSKNPFRYIAETEVPFRNFPFHLKYNNH